VLRRSAVSGIARDGFLRNLTSEMLEVSEMVTDGVGFVAAAIPDTGVRPLRNPVHRRVATILSAAASIAARV
jgi:hypothetical protein